ncbi:hypothetical protein [Streptomyces sp. A5-4]|uniref:hypothetical protein n=1 Tax=Streptomyces sp. A5-4 TaxID=3384771 RepID=UPI003DA964BC
MTNVPRRSGHATLRGQQVWLTGFFVARTRKTLLGESVVRVVGAYTVPIDTMMGLGGLMAAVTISATIVVSGRLAVAPMGKMIASGIEGDTGVVAVSAAGTDVSVDAR